MGIFSRLDTERYDRQYSDRELIRRMAGYFLPYRTSLFWVVVFILIISIAGASQPWIVSRGVDILEQDLSTANLILIGATVLVLGISIWLANWLRRRQTTRIIANIILNLRVEAFKASIEHDLSFYDEFSSGRIVSRITSDTQEYGQVVLLITDLISQFLQALILVIVLIGIDWQLSLYLFGILPFILLVALSFRRLARKVTRRGMRAMANVNAVIKETVSGITVAKNFRQEESIYTEFDDANKQSYQVNIQRGFVLALVFPVLNALGGVATAILVYVGGLSTAQGMVTIGAWYLFIQSLDKFFFPMLNLSAFWAQVQSGLSASERVFALIDAESAVEQIGSRPIPQLTGEIQFQEVNFSYIKGDQVLEKFNLHINAGETIALVGHTGAGKSSLARLIARFYEFQAGRILVDGHDIRTFDLSQYRRRLGIVSQVPFLFSGSVIENICYACASNVSTPEVEQIAHQIGNGEWLDTLPQGLDTQVGERGSRLSMGQRQLVSLMRVLVQKPSIFILDEATANIDPFTEWQIQQALNMILANTTSILIAHRLSTVKAADRIIVLDHGRIIEEGNHAKLIKLGGLYAHLYNTYFRHQSMEYVNKRQWLEEQPANLGD